MTDPISHHGPVRYEPVAVSAETTVAAEFVPGSASDTAYQLEAALAKARSWANSRSRATPTSPSPPRASSCPTYATS